MAYIKGIGLISAAGPGREDFRASLGSGKAPAKPDGFTVDLKKADKADLKNLRRADKLSKLSVLAAKEALRDASLAPGSGGIEAGVILCTGLGPHPTTFKFLDDIIQYGDKSVSPTTFSNSVHNAAASYIAAECGIEGPTLTVTQFFQSFHEGLALALSWLREGRVQRVLLGAVDVHGEVLEYVASRMLRPSEDGVLRPLDIAKDKNQKHVPGEGAAFMVLDTMPDGAYCRAGVETGFMTEPSGDDSSLLLIDSDGLIKDESGYLELIPSRVPVASYASYYGSMMSGSAFNAAAGALVLRERSVFPNPSPVHASPQGLTIADEKTALPSAIEVLRLNCSGRRGIIRLTAL
jgi:3-oxoacyl-[acyl-carrier-protein] synthase II